MSYSYSKYRLTNKPYNSERTSGVESNVLPDMRVNLVSAKSSYVDSSNERPLNIHINPNLLVSSGTVHVNKNKFSVNQNGPIRPQNTPSTSDNKIHYNPKFFINNQKLIENESVVGSVGCSQPKTIYINPQFGSSTGNIISCSTVVKSSCSDNLVGVQNPFVRDRCFESSVGNKDTVSCDKIHVNPYFIDNLDLGQDLTVLDSQTDLSAEKPSSNLNSDLIAFKPTQSEISQSSSSLNSKYRKINSRSPAVARKISRISKYKVQRSLTQSNRNCKLVSPLKLTVHNVKIPARKPRLSGSFKKIGNRKLVRKSLIQSYISSRRHSIPSMIQHSRNTLASRKKINRNISHNKYKFISCTNRKVLADSKLPNFKKIDIPSKSKLKWTRYDIRTQDFVKIGKRKIVRKSILQSLLEARRTLLNNSRKHSLNQKQFSKQKNAANIKLLRSRYKVTKGSVPDQSSQLNSSNCIRRNSSFNCSKKKDAGALSQFLKSKSIFFRMPPNLRLKIRLQEKQKRLMLLKKVNNRKKCLFYNRFGYCNGLDSGTCKKLHDPKSISVCRKFLKGLCDGEGCKLSHQVVPEKMPTCHQFLAGVCVRTSCPFLHVKLSDARPVCIDFLQGFCQEGNSCTKRHQFICPEWDEKGTCKADKCPYPHPQSNTKETKKHSKALKVNRLPHKKTLTDSVVAESDKIKNPVEDVKSRYFSSENQSKEVKSNEDRSMTIIERKPILKDGVNSVYKDESLLSFIPFS